MSAHSDTNLLTWRIAAAACAIVALLAAPAWSQENPATSEDTAGVKTEQTAADDEPRVFRGDITVEGSPIVASSEVDALGSLVTAVTEQQIDDLYAQDLTAALRRVPGVVISRYNPVGAFGGGDGGAFFIRGHGSGRPGGEISFLTDGVPRFVGVWTHPLIDVGNIDSVHQLDVYRSAQPVLLGNMAFAAVDIASKRRSAPGFGGRFTGSYGSFSTAIGNLELGGRGERVDYFLTAGYRSSDGHRDDADGDVTALSGKIGFDLSEGWDLSILVEHGSSSVSDPGAVGAPPLPIVPNYDIDNDFVLANLAHRHGSWHGTVKLYWDVGTFDWLQWSSSEQHPFRSITNSTNYGVRWRETVALWTGGELIAGIDHDLYGGEFVERHPGGDRVATDETFRNTAPYVALSHTFSGAVSVTPSVGVRYNDSRYFGDEWGAQAGIKVGFGGHQVYANAARGFNLPGVYAAVQYGGWGRGDQWQELEAETIDHLELGWLASFGRTVRLSVAIYRDEVDNAIRFVPPPPPPPLFANVGAYTADGVEVSLQLEPTERLSLFVGGTYSSSDPDDVPNLPETTAVAGLTWSAGPGVRLNADLQWVDSRFVLNPRFAPGQAEVDGYLLGNAKLDVPWRVFGLELDGVVFVAAENLFDEDYEHRLGYPMPGRSVQLGVELGF
jgi:iron complex outermembrane receptor protein